jgi:hypothetical protein
MSYKVVGELKVTTTVLPSREVLFLSEEEENRIDIGSYKIATSIIFIDYINRAF